MVAFFDQFKFGKKPPQAKTKAAGSASASVKTAPNTTDVRHTGLAFRILERQHQTEKAARLGANQQYIFVVPTSATKLQVKDAILAVYGVRPLQVNMMRVQGKYVRFGRTYGRQKSWKKAVVTLPAGKTITAPGV